MFNEEELLLIEELLDKYLLNEEAKQDGSYAEVRMAVELLDKVEGFLYGG